MRREMKSKTFRWLILVSVLVYRVSFVFVQVTCQKVLLVTSWQYGLLLLEDKNWETTLSGQQEVECCLCEILASGL